MGKDIICIHTERGQIAVGAILDHFGEVLEIEDDSLDNCYRVKFDLSKNSIVKGNQTPVYLFMEIPVGEIDSIMTTDVKSKNKTATLFFAINTEIDKRSEKEKQHHKNDMDSFRTRMIDDLDNTRKT